MRFSILICLLLAALTLQAQTTERAKELIPQVPDPSSNTIFTENFQKRALQIRDQAISQSQEPPYIRIPPARFVDFGKYRWHRNIISCIFWIGEDDSVRTLRSSEWDPEWCKHYGGYDNPNPNFRDPTTYAPKNFIPRLNPFYCALPFNDVLMGETKPIAAKIIPWFSDNYEVSGKSILKGRWVAIHHGAKTAFAQWDDCGPFLTDDCQYVFGNDRPHSSNNMQAGIEISPAVSDYLGMVKNELCDWKFVDAGSVPDGPWKYYGDNNTFALIRKGMNLYQYDRNNAKRSPTTTYTTTPSGNATH